MAEHSELMRRLLRIPRPVPVLRGDSLCVILMNGSSEDQEMVDLSVLIQQPQADHHRPSPALSSLRPLQIADLLPDTPATGRVLHGALISDALKLHGTVQVLTQLQDTSGETLLLAVKHALTSSASVDQVLARFPRGARVAVKEPTVQVFAGVRFVSLDNPANVEVISYLDEAEVIRLRWLPPSEIREYGKLLYVKTGGYEAAAQVYGLSAERAREVGLVEEEVVALSNRAECMLKLHRYEDCVDAAAAALDLDPDHLKSRARLVVALLHLHLYDWAAEVMPVSAQFDELRKMVRQSHDSAVFLEMISCFFEEWAGKTMVVWSRMRFPKFAEYVGPVEVRMSSEPERGRGLFASRSIRKGEVICLTTPLVLQGGETSAECNRDAVAQVVNMASHSRRVFEQMDSLTCKDKVPDMSLFRPNWISADEWSSMREQPSSGRREMLEGIVTEKMFDALSIPSVPADSCTYLRTEKYVLPSFSNYSCVPNVSATNFGGVLSLMAVRDIAKDEEILSSFFYPNHPRRHKTLEKRGFKCECPKCEVEKRLKAELEEVTGCYMKMKEPVYLPELKPDTDVPAMLSKLESVLKSEVETEDERQCLRCVHWLLYATYYRDPKLRRLPEVEVPELEVVMAAMRSFCPGFNFTFFPEMLNYVKNRDVAEKLVREEWECKLGKLSDAALGKVEERYLDLCQLLLDDPLADVL